MKLVGFVMEDLSSRPRTGCGRSRLDVHAHLLGDAYGLGQEGVHEL
ncbi:hypothetical protein SMF913_25205 [Streptomyces malaysiensis]|uniref:Uncharacterized protein n=1 Tax=Streptomyces malaysiensis TaxID=92644 RepID=A0A2J7YNY8_STRMQ|nr:hypothetical protein SMF913_25205 [Streptomyces malaysiensis]